MNTHLPPGSVLWLALIAVLVLLAVLPTLIAIARDVDDLGFIVVLNVLCCATVLGWPVALITALRWPPRRRPQRRRADAQWLSPPRSTHSRHRAHRRPPNA